MSITRPSVQVRWQALPSPHALAPQWQALEQRAHASFFLSWAWIGTWLRWLAEAPPEQVRPCLVSATLGGRTVGLAIVCEGPSRRRLRPFGRALHVHATGVRAVDALTLEYNGFLVDREHAGAASGALWQSLLAHPVGRQEIHLDLADVHTAMWPRGANGMAFECRAEPTWRVNLAAVRERGGDYLGLLSANRRARIRRGLRQLGTLGALRVHEAESVAQAEAYLQRLCELHSRRWGPSNFCAPRAQAFHRRLLQRHWAEGRVQLLRVQAGEHDVGLLYNFVHHGQVLFYQSGFDYAVLDGQQIPGLVSFALAIQYNAALGHDHFDFLAGERAYKDSLAKREDAFFTLALHRPSLNRQAEAWARNCWHAAQAWRHAHAMAQARVRHP